MALIPVAKVADVPEGGLKRVVVKARPIVLVQHQGKFYALDDTCTHEEASLSKGHLEDGNIVCPAHYSMFELSTGNVKNPPAMYGVRTHKVEIRGEDILVDDERV